MRKLSDYEVDKIIEDHIDLDDEEIKRTIRTIQTDPKLTDRYSLVIPMLTKLLNEE